MKSAVREPCNWKVKRVTAHSGRSFGWPTLTSSGWGSPSGRPMRHTGVAEAPPVSRCSQQPSELSSMG